MGVKPSVVRFRAEGYAPPLSPASEAFPLPDQFAAAAVNVDSRLVPSRTMAVQMLGALPEADATVHLISLCEDRSGPEKVRTAACLSLSKRTVGSEPVLGALERHANYLTGMQAPPVGPLAEASMNMSDARVLPQLLAHLGDPETDVVDLPQLMLAIKELADASVVVPVTAFLRLYHADADDPKMQSALEIAVDILAAQQAAAAAEPLTPIATDPLGNPGLRGYASSVLASLPVEATEGELAEEAAAEPEAIGGAVVEPEDGGRPARVTKKHLDKALAPVMGQLRDCIKKDPGYLQVARLTLILDGEGELMKSMSLPESIHPCIEPILLSVPFPANKHGKRQQLSYRLTR